MDVVVKDGFPKTGSSQLAASSTVLPDTTPPHALSVWGKEAR